MLTAVPIVPESGVMEVTVGVDPRLTVIYPVTLFQTVPAPLVAE